MSVRFQFTLPEDLAAELRQSAARRGLSVARFVRESIEERLRESCDARASDPFSWMDGLAETSETDLASRVDELLADAEEQKLLHAKAAKAIGVIEGDGDLSTNASERVREILQKRYGRR